MSTVKTLPNQNDVQEFINSLDVQSKKADSLNLLNIFKEATNQEPKMWGSSIIGFGMYHYKSERSNQQGDWPLVAFSPRKQSLTLYIIRSTADYSELLSKLGKHKTSKSCLYINKLSDVDLDILKKLIKISYEDAKQKLT